MTHVAIAGAGLVGRLLAWRLACQGWRVSLFDSAARGDTSSASMTAAAMLSPLAEVAVADAEVFAWGQRSMELWPRWLAELQAQTNRSVYFRREGTLVVAHPSDSGSLESFQRLLSHKLPLAYQRMMQELDAAGVAQLEPTLAGRFKGGLFLEGEGQLANDELFTALAAALDQRDCHWHENCTVHSLRAKELLNAQGACSADVVIDARGIGAKADWAGLRGVRGEVINVECRGVSLQRPVRLMHPRYQIYIAPRPNHHFVVGATELESEDSGPPVLRSVLELGSALYSVHPAFGEARVTKIAAALRPAFDDHRPAMRLHDGVWQINGLYRHGYLCAPALVEDLVKVLTT